MHHASASAAPRAPLHARGASRCPVTPIVALVGLLLASTAGSLDALVISEIMYHSEAAVDRSDEFIELYNETIDPLDLSGYTICNGTSFTFPRGVWLDGHTFLVVCADEASIRAKYGITNTIGNWVGSLENGGERVEICNPGGRTVVEVRYNDRGKWPVGADGTGHTLSLRNPYLDPDDADNWRLSDALGGTPGAANGPAFETGTTIEPPSGGMDAQGFIVTWLVLGPYTGSQCNMGNAALQADWLRESGIGATVQTDLVWEPRQEVLTDYALARSDGLHANARSSVPTVEEFVSFGDTIDLNDAVWPPNPEFVMAYAFVYVDNVTGAPLDVDLGMASDDAIAVMVNGVHRHVNDACRGVGSSGQVQDVAPVRLNAGKNLIAVKVFEHGGGWSFRLRVQERASGAPITSKARIQVTTDVNAGLGFDGSGEPIEDPGEEPPPPPPPGEDPGDSPVVINEGLFLTAGERWIELYNRSGGAVDLSGYHVTDSSGFLTRSRIPDGTSIPAGSYLTFTDAELGLSFAVAQPGDRIFVALVDASGARVLDAYNFEPELAEMSEARVPDGDSEFEGAADPTRGAANRTSVYPDLVIHEVMYHPIDDDVEKEYVEVFNRGSETVDLTGWAFTQGINYAFPPGAAIGPGEYLVVARNPRRIEGIYGFPAGSVFGPDDTAEALEAYGRLRDSGERITLKDHLGRTADTVRYRDGGEWPRWADGHGSSLELIDPWQDNRFGQAWDASDDSHKAETRRYSYVGRHGGGEPELHILLLSRGITIADNVSVIGGAVQNIDTPLVEAGETWRYVKGTQPPPAGWNDRGFNDADWLSGATGIGYGDGDDATVLDDMRGSYVTVFLRKVFTVSDPSALDELVLSAVVDDGFYAYLNGVQVASHNVSSPAFDASASTAGEPTLQERTLADPESLLVPGENVLAIQVHNAGTSSSDLSMIPRLVDRTRKFTEGSEQVTNGTFDVNTRGWIIEGTHIRSGRSTVDPIQGAASLKVIATGRGDNKVNRIETPEPDGFGLANLSTGEDLQISFDARWVVGSQTLLTHGYEHAMAKSHRLAVPEDLGTPGLRNSVTELQIARAGEANLGPVISDLVQDPPVPGAGETVTILARVQDPDGVASVRIRYSLNDPSPAPASRTMSHLGGGIYRGTIPGQTLGTKVVFYITAEDGGGRSGRYPVDVFGRTHPLVLDPSAPGLGDHRYFVYRHHTADPSPLYDSYRFWMTDSDEAILRNRRLLSNDLLPGSLVFNASRIYHESHVRFSGSPFARGGFGASFRVAMPRDRWLHERIRKMNLDNHHGNGADARERISHYLIRNNQGSIGVPYSDTQTLVRWQLNDAANNTLERVWVPDVQFLSFWYPDDDDGDFFEMDDRFVIDDFGGRRGNRDAQLRYPPSSSRSDGDGENKENYRWFFGLRAKNGADDYSRLIECARIMDPAVTPDQVFDEAVWDIVNVEEMLRIWAVRLNTADWDQWGASRGKNCYLYRPAVDGRFVLMAWDMELTYGDVNSFLIPSSADQTYNPGGFTEVNRLFNRTKVKRLWYGILDEMVNGPESWFHSDYLSPYMSRLAAIGMASTQIGQPGGFIDQRTALLRPRIAGVTGTSFRITTNSGNDFTTRDFAVDIAGAAPPQVCRISVNGEYHDVEYTGMTTWRIRDIPVPPGANFLELVAFNLKQEVFDADSITITNTNVDWEPPALASLEPATALAGEDIVLRGSGFHDGIRVFFGSNPSTRVVFSEASADPGRIVARVPPGTGAVAVRVENIDGKRSNSLDFTYVLPPPEFLRGDANGDGELDLSDGVKILFHLFRGQLLQCEDAADADDNEVLDLTDALRVLNHLYRDGPPPAAPYPQRGPDPSGDALSCDG